MSYSSTHATKMRGIDSASAAIAFAALIGYGVSLRAADGGTPTTSAPDAQILKQAEAGATLSVDACVKIAVSDSPQVAEAEAKVAEYEARLAEVESIYYPKLNAVTWVAPMFTVRGSAATPNVERHYKSLKDWGPYGFLEAVLAQPLYTFGRAEAGAEAAAERAAVERARLRQTRNTVALEVRKLFAQRLYAKSLLPVLEKSLELITEAVELAQESIDEGSGEITQIDLAKLTYVKAEISRYLREANDGVDLATAALKHTMGLAESTNIKFAGRKLPSTPRPPDPLPELLARAAEQRPEWAQVTHGSRAAAAWQRAEAKANWPIVFVAGQLRAAWTPQRTNSPNPYHFDPYNEVFGGLAVGLLFDLDPAKASAKADVAAATSAQVEALRRFAATGIPLQVRKAHQEVVRSAEMAAVAKEGMVATRRWMTFAAAAYKSGTGEARDLVEGLVAYLQAKKTHYDVLVAHQVAHAELRHAVGSLTEEPEPRPAHSSALASSVP